ncbi:hypothetical protein VCRA2113O415_350017 [Vibrio crassostreae]|nr:hypothetical protein VCRA2113O415_350017 [Vibrio crassostreae]
MMWARLSIPPFRCSQRWKENASYSAVTRVGSELAHLGRFPNKQFQQRIQELAEQGMNKHTLSKELGCSRTTFY